MRMPTLQVSGTGMSTSPADVQSSQSLKNVKHSNIHTAHGRTALIGMPADYVSVIHTCQCKNV